MAKYSESDKKVYAAYVKKGGRLPFGQWMVERITRQPYGADARALYKMSDTSKKNRGKVASNKKERP